MKEKQKLKSLKSQELTKLVGRRDKFRSTKKEFKPVVKKVDDMDDQTRDEKEYLEPELFGIMQAVKEKFPA